MRVREIEEREIIGEDGSVPVRKRTYMTNKRVIPAVKVQLIYPVGAEMDSIFTNCVKLIVGAEEKDQLPLFSDATMQAVKEAADNLQDLADQDGVTATISCPDIGESVTFTPKAKGRKAKAKSAQVPDLKQILPSGIVKKLVARDFMTVEEVLRCPSDIRAAVPELTAAQVKQVMAAVEPFRENKAVAP